MNRQPVTCFFEDGNGLHKHWPFSLNKVYLLTTKNCKEIPHNDFYYYITLLLNCQKQYNNFLVKGHIKCGY